MRKRIKFLSSLCLVFFILFRLGGVIRANWDSYSTKYNFKAFEKIYLQSQYVSLNPSGWIPDEAVYSYAAGAYLRGVNPILINPEHPPLGKYIISLFILLFNRANLSVLVFGLLTVFLFFILGQIVLADAFWSLVSVAILISERLFVEQFIYLPLLDIFQLAFIFLSFIFFIKGLTRPRFFLLANLFLGCTSATKFYLTAFLVLLSWVLFLGVCNKKRKTIFSFFLSLPFIFLVPLASYFRYFMLGGNLRDFWGVQKWIFLFHQGKNLSPFYFWALVFCNRWRVWWGEKRFISCVQWQITWPISILVAFFISFLFFKKKPFWNNKKIGVIISWFLIYLLFLSVGQVSPRYLIPLLPFSHLIFVYGVSRRWKR